MVGLPKMLFIFLILICLGSQVESDASNHRYKKGDIIPFYASKVGPYFNPQEAYAYYDLPYCSPDTLKEKKQYLGEMFDGNRLVSTRYQLEFLVDKDIEVICNKTLTKADVSQFKSVIEKNYYIEFYYDDLPVWSFIGYVSVLRDSGYERIKNQYLLYKHVHFDIFYNEDRVIMVNLTMDSPVDLTEDKEVVVDFKYSVRWLVTRKSFEERMDIYIDYYLRHTSLHRYSITYSSVTVFIFIICLLTFYALVLHKDIFETSHDVEEDQVADNEETGWKKIHGDVFRFPKHKSLLAAALGSGTHLLLLIVSILVLGHMGYFQPYARGMFWNAVVTAYVVTSVVSGYTSVSFYSQLEGTTWMKNILLAGGLYIVPLFLTFGFVNTIAVSNRTTAAVPLEAIVILCLIWIFFASPLLLLGGFVGKNNASNFQAPCRTSKCPKEVPPLRWYRGLLPQMALAGILPFSVIYAQIYYIFATVWGYRVYTLYSILLVIFSLLLIITALVSVALTYFQLAAEDHQWWWRSFFCGGSTGLYMYGYCIYYYFWMSNMTGLLQTSFFFGYMACVSYGIFLVLGSVAFRASLLFVQYLYAAIKSD